MLKPEPAQTFAQSALSDTLVFGALERIGTEIIELGEPQQRQRVLPNPHST